MKRMLLAVCAICTLAMVGCKNRSEEVPEHDSLTSQIAAYEGELQMLRIDSVQADSIIGLYNEFVHYYPQDTNLCAQYLFKAARVLVNIGQPDSALTYFDRIIDEYSDAANIADCYFYKADAFEQAGHTEDAVAAYEYFLEAYPKHPNAEGLKTWIEELKKEGSTAAIANDFAKKNQNSNVPVEKI